VIILAGLLGLSINSHISLAAPNGPTVLTIEVIGHRWWWEVRYPNEGIVSANEIHIPVVRPVEIHLTSRDVIHSFWVPQLAGKLDLNPGETNSMWLQADEPGIYRGICAVFCGLQHANMLVFFAVAVAWHWPNAHQQDLDWVKAEPPGALPSSTIAGSKGIFRPSGRGWEG
jgi:cytochrome c oxidase subunit II